MIENITKIDYHQVIEYSLEPIVIHTNLKIIYVNHAAEKLFRETKANIIGASPLDIFRDTSKLAIETRIDLAYQQPAEVIEEIVFRMDGTSVEVELYCHPVKIGSTKAIQTYVRDITGRKESERKNKEIIEQINELSLTLVPLLDGIAVLPLVGSFDESRGRQLLDDVPIKVKTQNIVCLIIDFSGIYNLDDVVAHYLFQINEVLTLLGVRTILTGLRPELALIANQLDIDLTSKTIHSTVKSALNSLGFNKGKEIN